MSTTYDTQQDLYAAQCPSGAPFAVGQDTSKGEVDFWYNLGYTIFRLVHNGDRFEPTDMYG